MGDSSSSSEDAESLRPKRRRQRKKILNPSLTGNNPASKENSSDDDCAIYSSLRTKSMNFEKKTEKPITAVEVAKFLTENRSKSNENSESDFCAVNAGSDGDECFPSKRVKCENAAVVLDSDEEKKLEIIRKKARFKEMNPENFEVFEEVNSELTPIIRNSSDPSIILPAILDILYDEEKRFKLFFKFGQQKKTLSVTGSEKLQDLLVLTGFDFPTPPRVYTTGGDPNAPDINLLPLEKHAKSVNKLGFQPMSVLNCHCLQKEESGSDNLAEFYGKLIITFKLSDKQKFQFYSEPSDPFSKTINKFESSQKDVLNFENAKYYFDGDLVDVNETPASLDMESGDIIDVYLEATEIGQDNGE